MSRETMVTAAASITSLVGGPLTLRRAVMVATLVGAWCALWGSPSVANIASGLAVAIVALRVGAGPSARGGIHVVPLVRFAGRVATDLVASTLAVIVEVITPTDHTEEGIIAVPLPPGGRSHLFLLYIAITVTPGTAVVAAEADRSVLYLHVLRRDRRDDVVAHVDGLARLAAAALPTPDRQQGRTS